MCPAFPGYVLQQLCELYRNWEALIRESRRSHTVDYRGVIEFHRPIFSKRRLPSISHCTPRYRISIPIATFLSQSIFIVRSVRVSNSIPNCGPPLSQGSKFHPLGFVISWFSTLWSNGSHSTGNFRRHWSWVPNNSRSDLACLCCCRRYHYRSWPSRILFSIIHCPGGVQSAVASYKFHLSGPSFLRSWVEKLREIPYVRIHPWPVLAIDIGIGIGIGASIPKSEEEVLAQPGVPTCPTVCPLPTLSPGYRLVPCLAYRPLSSGAAVR